MAIYMVFSTAYSRSHASKLSVCRVVCAQLIYFFTAGEDEVKCWQIRKGCKAPQARPQASFAGLCADAAPVWSLVLHSTAACLLHQGAAEHIPAARMTCFIAMSLALTCCMHAWLQAAGAIHTDFERGFICAEVMHYDELKELGSEAAVKAAGKYRQEGEAPPTDPAILCGVCI